MTSMKPMDITNIQRDQMAILNTVNHRNTQPPSVTHAGTRHFKCNRTGHMKHQCPMNLNRTAAMYQMNDQEAAMSSYPYGEPHNCNESRGDGEVKLACGACYQS